jgi:protein-disulfide isomerase
MKKFIVVLLVLIGLGIFGCTAPQIQTELQEETRISAEAQREPVDGPSIELVEKRIDLGVIGAEDEEIEGRIFYINVGSEPLRVVDVDGPCNCFEGYSGDMIVEPKDAGEIIVKFDKNKIPAGPIERMVRIKTNDPIHEAVEVRFALNIERDPMQEELRKLNDEVRKLRTELRVVRNDLRKVLTKLDVDSKAQPRAKKEPDTTVYDVAIGSSPVLGPEDAAVTIVEFVDLQCPYCVREYPKIKRALRKYPDDVKVVFKHYPLKFHKQARPAHAAVELAKLEGGNEAFWKMHDMIIRSPKNLEISDLRGYAETLGLDLAKFDEVVSDEKKIDELLEVDLAEAKKCKVTGTPTVLINGLKLAGRSIQAYDMRIDKILEESKKTAAVDAK